jgi:glyoxylase-like metal-dependent hydrolase (beta-lactamase superfamily II)
LSIDQPKAKKMQKEIKVISLPLPFRMGRVNCYLISADEGYILIDSGGSNSRMELLGSLENAGCKPGQLNLVVLTHGDFDHIGNAAYLRAFYGARLAMHRDDAGMAEQGDMFVNRKQPNVLIKALIPRFMGLKDSERFTPDILLDDGDDLAQHGLEAKIVGIPGHSKGSLGVLTSSGELFCGDLLVNTDRPGLNSLIDDPSAAQASLDSLEKLEVSTVYPGHGLPFDLKLLWTGKS